jgi:hypothetical protein
MTVTSSASGCRPVAKRKRGIRQGDPLPHCPIRLGDLPVGVCVHTPAWSPKVKSKWWMIVFRIGDSPMLGAITDPTKLGWVLSDHRYVGSPLIVASEVCWPARPNDDDRTLVDDPLGGAPQDGPLFDR